MQLQWKDGCRGCSLYIEVKCICKLQWLLGSAEESNMWSCKVLHSVRQSCDDRQDLEKSCVKSKKPSSGFLHSLKALSQQRYLQRQCLHQQSQGQCLTLSQYPAEIERMYEQRISAEARRLRVQLQVVMQQCRPQDVSQFAELHNQARAHTEMPVQRWPQGSGRAAVGRQLGGRTCLRRVCRCESALEQCRSLLVLRSGT